MRSNNESLNNGSSLTLTTVPARLDALKSLTALLLREIEALQKAILPKGRTDISKINLQSEIQAFEMDLISNALIRCNGNQRGAARLLDVGFTTLNAKIKRYGIEIFEIIERGPNR